MGNVLVIDDDLEILEVVKLLLTTKGLKVKTESNWENIFQEIKTFEPDVILMDIGLGFEDGRNITRQIKSSDSTCHIPVILISGITGINKNLGDCLNDDFISKPFNSEDLFYKIQNQILKIPVAKNINEHRLIMQMMMDNPCESINLFYKKYAPILFGYILSITKNEAQSEKIFIEIYTGMVKCVNYELKNESFLLQCIRIANRAILKKNNILTIDFSPILKKNDQAQNN